MQQKAKISGVTIVKNAVEYDYPIVECINSLLPIVDEMIVSIGDCTDTTEALIKSIASNKIKIVHTLWDKSLTSGGTVLAAETDKALQHVSPLSDWVFYLQADEVIHENDYDAILTSAQRYKNDANIEGLLFDYKHFYGTFNYIGDSRQWYSHEVRMIKNDKQIKSYRDAQGFRKNDQKLNVKKAQAFVYHYGWVRTPSAQQKKNQNFSTYWGANAPDEASSEAMFDYLSNADSLALYTQTHPKVMAHRIESRQVDVQWDISKKRFSKKDWLLYKIEKWTGKRLFAYKNYRLV
jgi:hypothetical protein